MTVKIRDHKFKDGSVLYHAPSKSRWLVLGEEEVCTKQYGFWKLKIRAYCIYHPSADKLDKSCLWRVNAQSTFWLQDKDLSPKDKIWKVLYEK